MMGSSAGDYYLRWEEEKDIDMLREAYRMLVSDPSAAILRLARLADAGSTAAACYLADAYERGIHVPKALDRAAAWYGRAEQLGWIPAPHRIGRICFDLKDYSAAFSAFERGAEKDYPPSLYRLALMHRDGIAVTQNLFEARKLLQSAQIKGHLYAKRDLATILIKGKFGLLNVFNGLFMLAGLIFDFVMIVIKVKSKDFYFDDRILC